MKKLEHVHGVSVSSYMEDERIILSIIPASGVRAVFEDGESYPVFAWANCLRVVREEGEADLAWTEVVGLIIGAGVKELRFIDCPDFGKDSLFSYYDYEDE